ncbi:2792_t:CDS:2, partial [Funneliformis mosseae]
LNANVIDFDVKTTPQLHYVTRCYNTQGTEDDYGVPSEDGYYKKLATAFRKIVVGRPRLAPFYVDAANGVGAPKIEKLAQHIGSDIIEIMLINDDITTRGKLNYKCGADFVKTEQGLPAGCSIKHGDRAASLDGDADRIVFYYIDEGAI